MITGSERNLLQEDARSRENIQLTLKSKPMELALADIDETLQICRAR